MFCCLIINTKQAIVFPNTYKQVCKQILKHYRWSEKIKHVNGHKETRREILGASLGKTSLRILLKWTMQPAAQGEKMKISASKWKKP